MPSRAIDQYCGAAGRMWPSSATPSNRIRLPLPQRPMLKSDPQARRDYASARARVVALRVRGEPRLAGTARALHGRRIQTRNSDVPMVLSSIILDYLSFFYTFYILNSLIQSYTSRYKILFLKRQDVFADCDLVSKLSCVPNMVSRRAARRRREIADRTTIAKCNARKLFHSGTPYVRKEETGFALTIN